MQSHQRVVTSYYIVRFVGSLNFQLPIWVLFGHDYLHLSYLTSIVLLTLPQYFFGSFFQVPCGAWADRHGRKRALIIGSALTVASMVPWVLTKSPAILFLTVPFTVFGSAFAQGSLEAIVSSFSQTHKHLNYSTLTTHGVSLFYLARVVASPVGGFLFGIDPRLPFAADICAGLAALAVVFTLPDDEPHVEGSAPTSVARLVAAGTSSIHRLSNGWLLLAIYFVIGVAFEMLWLGYQPTFAAHHITSTTVGFAFAGFSVLSALGSQALRILLRTMAVNGILRVQLALLIVSACLLLVLPGWWVLAAVIPVQLVFGTTSTVLNIFLATRTPRSTRATVLSYTDLVGNVAIGIGSLVGAAVMDDRGPGALFLMAGCVAMAMLVGSLRLPFTTRADANF